ncbi:MAG: histidine kinase [Candidatus Parabeggiatoa sp. nov. 3]|nr:MAG: histidine kinase [Gammaproteobacteria bacterium]RKZ62728.1 MAG: histidine kinase [Gammaproteobacteria bacterium]RKZ85401.1 MAG: histidine kinase [Gammaproteobacteria bacterium]
MTIGRKLTLSFTFMLAMFIGVGLIVYILNARIIQDATDVTQDDVPSAILSLSLLEKMAKIDANILKYFTGKAAGKTRFDANIKTFLNQFEELSRIETKPEEVKMMQKIERLFLDYVNTADKEIFGRYDPKAEQWANQQNDKIVHQFGIPLKTLLEKATEADLQKIQPNLNSTQKSVADQLQTIQVYIALLNKAGDLIEQLTEYVAGRIEGKQAFMSHVTAFEKLINQLNLVDKNSKEIIRFQTLFSLYTQLKNGAEEIFGKYDPRIKKEALATAYRLDQDALEQLETILNTLAAENKHNAIAATRDIILIVKEMTVIMMIVIVIAAIMGLLISVFLSRSISQALSLIVKGSQLLVAGDFALSGIQQSELDKLYQRKDEIGDLGKAFQAQVSYFKTVIEDIDQVSQGLAEGNFSVTPQSEYRGNFIQIKKALEIALSNQKLVIEDIVRVSQGLAAGDLSVRPESDYQGDFLHIKNAQETALSNQRLVVEDIVQVSQGLAAGNLHVMSKAQYRGDFVQIKEALETALSNLRLVIEDIVHVSQELAEGTQNITPQAEYRGNFIDIKQALETAATKLAAAMAKNAEQDWLKTGQTQLNDHMSGELEIEKLAKKIISFITTYTKAQVGLFYLLKETKSQSYLQIIASYAYTANKQIPDHFLLGEGLVGQAALEQQTIFRTHNPDEYTHIIQSGLSQAVPRHVIMIPFLYENQVKGVIEIGSTKALTVIRQTFLEQAMSNIGIAINTAESRTQQQALLEQSQRQTEELQVQSEELQAQQEEMQQINEQLQSQREELEEKQEALQHRNEELQSQSEELQSQSEELQTQQEELKQTNEELEHRTQELEGQKEAIQQKNIALETSQMEMEKARTAIEIKAQELELASQYKSEFLANMSHELRTPLNSLLILSQLLADNKQGNLSEKQVSYAQTIQSAGSDLLTLINDILDLSKVEAGKMEVNIEALSLSDLIETLEHKFRPLAQKKGLVFQFNIDDDVPAVLQTDAQRLKQILNNLLSNAFKFTDEGEIKLTIQSKLPLPSIFQMGKSQESNFIAISVKDTGIGIPQDKQQLIFEAFQQVDGTTSRRYGGTGLGLSISRQLARLIGGEMTLESETGSGSQFTLYLPEILSIPDQITKPKTIQATRVSNPEPESSTSEVEPLNTSSEIESDSGVIDDRATLKPDEKTLLIIEDDRKFSTILFDLGHEKGFQCLIAEDGRIGLQFAQAYLTHAIILDINLPNLDGWTVLERLKDNPQTRHIPVHFISAADQNTLDATKMGAIGFLRKPVNMTQLAEVFKKIEQFITNPIKTVLIVVDVEPHQEKILELVSGDNIQTTVAVTSSAALGHLKDTFFDCIILDMDIENGSGRQLLEKMQQQEGLCQTPLIVYADRDLIPEEEALLLQCADHLPIKAVSSSERLLDEATLFLHQVEANLPAPKRKMLRMVHDKESILNQKKVLIVDDDVRNVFALATVLEERNMEVIAGNNGVEGLELLEENQDVAIVLMDIMMPEMDGYEAMRKIRQHPQYRKLPIIALTAKAMKGDKSKCIDAGANDYLSKPVDTDKLISLMRVWLYR